MTFPVFLQWRRSLWMLVLLGPAWLAASQTIPGVPLRPDPPFAIDGALNEWNDVPNVLTLNQPEQVVWGRAAWQSPQDLSGIVRLAWRQEYLFLAVEVTDDALCQTQRGSGLWKGDHVEIYLDTQPDVHPERDPFGEGQFQLGLSPGNFGATGDPLADCPPEAYCYQPEGGSVEGVVVASSRTPVGWSLEAAIPWKLLGVEQAASGLSLRYEVGLSDTDTSEPQQECLMTVSSAPWAHARSRLTLAALAGSDGIAAPIPQRIGVFDELTLQRGENKSFAVSLPTAPPDREPILVLDARLQFDKVAGNTPALRLIVNGQLIAAGRLLNKPLRARARSGEEYSMAAGELFTVSYTPDFASADNDPHYGLLDAVKACAFEFNIAGLVKEGENTLVVSHEAAPEIANPLIAANAAIVFRAPPPPPAEYAGPPTGPLDVIQPRTTFETVYTARALPEARIEVVIGGETFLVESLFSTPEPGWVNGTCRFFSHERSIEHKPELVLVRDTFTNLTAENLPLMHRHRAALADRLKGVWLGGLKQGAAAGSTSDPANPTTYAETQAHGIGFAALDDVSRIHVTNYALNGEIGIADNALVLPANTGYAVEWAIVPTDTPDYWAFINVLRRLLDVNFTIDGGFAFLRATPETDAWSDGQIADFIRLKDARYVCASILYPLYNGYYPHGTAFQHVTRDNYRVAFERWRTLVPESKYLVYFHCFIDAVEDGAQRFADARLLRPDGAQASYGKEQDRIYIPTETNSFGPEIAKNVDLILDEIKADGVYWDEHEYSRWPYHYGQPWDGRSGDIDPQRMTITRLKSSVTLLSEPWRLALAKRILERGPLIGNSPPYTRAMAALKFPCFVETGSITHCTQAHLYSPIALGDHLTERSELDAYRTMLAALDYGCVYHWYHDLTIVPTHHHLTRYMYPITPMELHAGYVIGRERIITKKSGLFGWGDSSQHEVHVFDDLGKEVEGFQAPLVAQDGKNYTELRIAEGWSAAIVRK